MVSAASKLLEDQGPQGLLTSKQVWEGAIPCTISLPSNHALGCDPEPGHV